MFRLKIDIPLSEDETISAKTATEFMEWLVDKAKHSGDEKSIAVSHLQYLMACDEDRSVRNYLDKDVNGHASTRKSKLHIG
jgi:hypothetical protein